MGTAGIPSAGRVESGPLHQGNDTDGTTGAKTIREAGHWILIVGLTGLISPLLFAAGCSGFWTLHYEQYRELTHVTFPDHTPEEVKQTAREVLARSDDRMQINSTEDRLHAVRWWKKILSPVVLYGTDQWHLTFHPGNGGTWVHLKVTTLLTHLEEYVRHRTVSPDGPAVYELFWRRVRSLLEGETPWMSCEQMQQRIDQGETFGRLSLLCDPPHKGHLQPND